MRVGCAGSLTPRGNPLFDGFVAFSELPAATCNSLPLVGAAALFSSYGCLCARHSALPAGKPQTSPSAQRKYSSKLGTSRKFGISYPFISDIIGLKGVTYGGHKKVRPTHTNSQTSVTQTTIDHKKY